VEADEEIRRTVPVIERLAEALPEVPISIDTKKASVAAAACGAGASIINDVSAGSDPEMFHVASANRAAMVLMHMQGDPKTMQEAPTYGDVVAEVHDALAERIAAAVEAGVEPERICVDPGIGFGKTLEHNLSLMKHTDALADLGRPILVGPSRKAFIGTLLGVDAGQRLEGTAGATAYLIAAGAHGVRVHDVRELTRVVRIVDAIKAAK
jgi:dihydropteroate synthase